MAIFHRQSLYPLTPAKRDLRRSLRTKFLKPNKLVVVRADRGVILNKAVKVMDVAKAAGAGRLCLATEKDF